MKRIIRFVSVILILVMGLSGIASAAYADEMVPYSNAYIRSIGATVSKSGDTLYVTFTVKGTGPMTSIGASCVQIYTAGGTPVKTFWSSSNPSMLGSNCTVHTSSVSYDGTDGTSYYAVVTGYASNSSGSSTETYTTSTITL